MSGRKVSRVGGTPRQRRGRHLRWSILVASAAILAACTVPTTPPTNPPPSTLGSNPDLAPQADVAAYSGPGPYAAGVTTVEIEPGRRAEIWYPAPAASAVGQSPDVYHMRDFISPFLQQLLKPEVDPTFTTTAYRGLPVAGGGPFPLVLFSHGFAGYRLQSTFLTAHLATWGFVVISPDYFERGLQSLFGTPPAPNRSDQEVAQLAVDAAIAQNTGADDLHGKIDTTRLFPVGHSAGGSETTQLAARTDVQSWIALSSGYSTSSALPVAMADPNKAAMWIVGAQDGVAQPSGVRTAYDYTAGPAKLIVIPQTGHLNGMSDICEIARDQGGIVGLAISAGLPIPDFLAALGRDGCPSPPFALSSAVWPITRHFVTAELRYRAGLDPQPVGLGAGVVNQFGAIVPEYQHTP